MKSGIELIAIERQEQIDKHSRSVFSDIRDNSNKELSRAAHELLHDEPRMNGFPSNWDASIVSGMIGKSYRDRLIIAGAFIAAEIDRLNNIEDMSHGFL